MIKNGQKVRLEYTVFLEDGTQIDTNVGEDPLVFVLGAHQVFPALEQALLGLQVGIANRSSCRPKTLMVQSFPMPIAKSISKLFLLLTAMKARCWEYKILREGFFQSEFIKSTIEKSCSTSTIRWQGVPSGSM